MCTRTEPTVRSPPPCSGSSRPALFPIERTSSVLDYVNINIEIALYANSALHQFH